MTKRKNVVSKMLLLVVILTLISCCFLGSTFARYTSSGSGTGTLQVAKWDVSHGEDAITVEFDKLSPSKYDYATSVDSEYVAGTARTNTTGKILVATITNKGDVDAEVEVTAENIVITKVDSANYGTAGIATEANPTTEEVEAVFSIKLYKGNSASELATANLTELGAKETVAATNGTLYIYAEVTWTSDVGEITGATADKLDTWIGQYVTSVQWTISYTAVQATELPNA